MFGACLEGKVDFVGSTVDTYLRVVLDATGFNLVWWTSSLFEF